MPIQLPEAFEFLFATKADDGLAVRYRVGHGGRGSAKSHSFCSVATIKGAQRPLRFGVYREIQKSIRDSAKRLLDAKIAENGLSGFYESTDTEIRGANGTLFTFGGLRTNPEAIKSTEGLDIAIVMEAAKVSKRSWDLLIPTVRAEGSEIWVEYNPDLEDDPVDVKFRGPDGPPPGSIVRQINFNDNPFFPDTLRQEMEYDLRRDPERHAHIWLGGYRRNSDAQVFKNWRVEAFDTPADAVLRFGADWGFAQDPTVLVRMFIGRYENGVPVCDPKGRTLFVDYESYKVGCEIDETPSLFAGDCPPSAKVKWTNTQRHLGVPGAHKWLITGDGSRPETISYMKRHGFRIVPAIKGAGSVQDGIEFLKSYDIVVHPRCVHVAAELRLYSWEVDPITYEVLSTLADKDNHTIDAARYALEGLRRARKPDAGPTDQPQQRRDYKARPQREEGSGWMAV